MQRNLKWASDAANRRVANGEISGRMAHELIRTTAAKFAETINPADIDDQNAWRYGEIYRAAEWWKQAKPTLKRAASYAEKSGDTDRWVNDVLRYAQTTTTADGSFHLKHLAPGRYYLLAKPIKGNEGSDVHPLAWDSVQRAALRREAETATQIVELQPCQRLNDYKLGLGANQQERQ